jgi:integrase
MAKKATRDGLYCRNGIWWIRTDPVTRIPRSTKCRDKEAAKLVRAAREREAADPAHAAASQETLRAACERLIESRQAMGKPIGFHTQKLGHWIRIFGDDRKLADFGPPEFDLFTRQRRIEGVTDHTISKEVRCMITVLKKAKRAGRYAGDPSVLRPTDLSSDYVPRERAMPPLEFGLLLGELGPARGAFVALCVALGVRRGELYRLQPADVNLEQGVVHVRGTKTKLAKRTIPILPPFRGLVEACVPHLPLEPWGNYLRDLKAACVRAGIEKVTANDFRRTHATLLQSAGVDRDITRRLLGHSPKSKMLEAVYDKPKPLELAERAGSLSALTLQMDSVEIRTTPKTRRAPQDSNLRPTAPEALTSSVTTALAEVCGGRAPLETRGAGRESAADHSRTLHGADPLLLGDLAAILFASARARGVTIGGRHPVAEALGAGR